MLVLTRKANESIMLGKDIEIIILAVEEGRVKIGIAAPRNVEIMRKEIYVEIQEENKAASAPIQGLEDLKAILKK